MLKYLFIRAFDCSKRLSEMKVEEAHSMQLMAIKVPPTTIQKGSTVSLHRSRGEHDIAKSYWDVHSRRDGLVLQAPKSPNSNLCLKTGHRRNTANVN